MTSDLDRLADDYNAMRRERDAALERAAQYERDWYAAKSEYGTSAAKLREALRQETRVALDYQQQRDEARAQLDALRVELLEVQHEIGESWFADGVAAAEALRRKTMMAPSGPGAAKMLARLLGRIGRLRKALTAAASSLETIADGRVDADALPHQQDIFGTRAYAAGRARVARAQLIAEDGQEP